MNDIIICYVCRKSIAYTVSKYHLIIMPGNGSLELVCSDECLTVVQFSSTKFEVIPWNSVKDIVDKECRRR